MSKSQAVVEDPKVITGSLSELENLIKATMPLIQVVSHDEDKFINEFYQMICKKHNMQLFVWSSWQGVIPIEEDENGILQALVNPKKASGDWDGTASPNKALEKIVDYKVPKSSSDKSKNYSRAIFLMRDFHTVLAQPIPRIMRDMYQHLVNNSKTILCMGGTLAHGPGATKPGMEPSLEKQMIVYRWSLPTREEIEAQMRKLINDVSEKTKIRKTYTDDEFYKASRALQGLTNVEVENAIAVCCTERKELNQKRLLQEKKQIIMRSEILEYIDSDKQLTDIGGLDNLKDYITTHSHTNNQDAVDFGVDPLKGVLLLGIPGSGKSLTAKAFGNAWEVPTLRLDIGKVMTGLVGGSEQKMREVVAQAAAVAPCVLWLDEVEKALSGTKSSNFSDGGTLARVFGTLLTAMEEGLPGVTLVATANDISALPAELIRRFTEVFFVGLPETDERKEIFKIHLAKKNRDWTKFNLDELAEASNKYTGAEIEKAVKEGIARCYHDGKRELTTQDLVQAIQDTKPISRVMDKQITDMQDWARNRARFASSLGAEAAGLGKQKVVLKSGKELNISDVDEVVKPKKSKKSRLDNVSTESGDSEKKE
jgi:ATP-dependent 26S proteasome regulatory subunit